MKRKVFWAGTNIAPAEKLSRPAESEQFIDAMKSICPGHGCVVQRFLSASGNYGSWLLEFNHDSAEQRIIWDGKQGQLALQKMSASGNWETTDEESLSNPDEAVFGSALTTLIERIAPPAV